MCRAISCDDRRLDALGRLVEQHHHRLADHRAGDGELLLLAAATGCRPTGARAPSSTGKVAVDPLVVGLAPARCATTSRDQQVLADRQASGRRRGPAGCRRGRRGRAGRPARPSRRAPPKRIAAGRGREQADQSVRISVVLPTPLRPMTATISPRPTSRSTPEQHRAGAVAAAQAFDREEGVIRHGRSRDRSPRRPRWPSISEIVPCREDGAEVQHGDPRRDLLHEGHVVLDHEDGHAVAVERRAASRRSCSVSSGDMPAVGSSSSSRLGSTPTAMPISSHCFWPCDSVPAGRAASGPRPVKSRTRRIVASSRWPCEVVLEARSRGSAAPAAR